MAMTNYNYDYKKNILPIWWLIYLKDSVTSSVLCRRRSLVTAENDELVGK